MVFSEVWRLKNTPEAANIRAIKLIKEVINVPPDVDCSRDDTVSWINAAASGPIMLFSAVYNRSAKAISSRKIPAMVRAI